MNSINQKELEVEVAFQTNGKVFTIKRGIKPNIFEIWRDGELINQDAAARDYQAYLEDHVLKMNFKSFGQIVVLGSSTFVPFMQLPAGQRREVIEDLLDIQIFTTMNLLLKDKVSENKTEIQDLKYHIDLVKDRIQSARDHNAEIAQMKSVEITKIKERVAEHLKYIEEEESKITTIDKIIEVCLNDIQDQDEVKAKKKKIEAIEIELNNKLKTLKKDRTFFENHDDCPTCRQSIDEEFKTSTIETTQTKEHEIVTALENLNEKKTEVEDRIASINSINEQIASANLKASEHRANIKLTKNQLAAIRKDLEQAEKEAEAIDNSKIEELENELRTYHIKNEQLINDKEVLSVVSSMLKDGGIKTRIIKQYVPVMNKLINKYLAAMDFFVDFQLDENFNETIKSRFRDVFSYASFSEGEKLRIDLALLFTWRAVSKLRNSVSTNLLIMDEIMDSSLDNAGTEEFLKIINELTNDSNIFIISHKGDQLYDKFESVLKFKKVKNFSIMEA
jgi:DNA repair exonuclease SbcCD ATPase subunit